jgi:polyhydroxyalkanoate synthesis regulator phasin
MRKAVGITVPYREVGYKEPIKLLEEKVKELEKRIEQLEKEKK